MKNRFRSFNILCVVMLTAFMSGLLWAMIANGQLVATPKPTAPAVVTPIPVIVSQTPVPVSFSLPISVLTAWILSIATGLTGVMMIARFTIKVSGAVMFLSGLRPTIERISSDVERLKKHAGIE